MMSVTEHQRNKLHNRVHDVLGVEEGDALMASLPPAGWGDVVSCSYLDQALATVRAEFRAEIAESRAEFRAETAEFRSEMRTELASHRAETKADIAELRSEMHQAISRMTWTMTVAMIATVIASAGFAFTAGLAL